MNFKNENFLLGLLVSVIFFKSKNILWIIGDQLPNLTKPETFLSYLGLTITNTVIITLLIALVISLLLKAFSHARNLRPSLSLVFISSLIFAIIFNYTLQFGVKTDTPLLEQYIFPGATSYQIFILLLLFLVIYIGSNRYLGSTLLFQQ
ncbi:hypothetical protein N1496_01610 [Streptococcus didelphis]|uniref:LTA synthase family protein n=1 Tax=Streptococcus didelphis TaxID=102886 RepID=A0ABY9LHM8_9STRE|nr:hypothetical protein [Streptococcus didelphis]WMB28357.1 hypothetical protein N1496_01610 [Streptococcus didelphis]